MGQEQILFWLGITVTFLVTALVVLFAFDAISRPQLPSSKILSPTPRQLERRRSERVAHRIRLLVYGQAAGSKPFYDEAMTLQINDHGALLMLTARVKPGQWLLLTHERTRQEQECHVVRVGRKSQKERAVAVEFTQPKSDFW